MTILSIVANWEEGIGASIIGFVLIILSYTLIRLKKLTVSSLIFLFTILVVSLISAYFGSGIFDSTLFLIPILIIAAGLLLKQRLFILFSVISLFITIIVMILSWKNIHSLPSNDDFIGVVIIVSIFFILTLISTGILIKYLRDSTNESKMNEERFRSITEKLNLGIFSYTPDGKLNYANDYLCEKLGYSREEILTKNFIEFIHPDHRQMIIERAKARLGGKEVVENYEIKSIFKDGSIHWLDLSASMVSVDDKVLVLGGIFDITNKKELEKQVFEEKEQLEKAQKLESLGVLAGGIAHDFNNLLTGIMGNISLINLYMEKKDDAKIEKSLKNIQQVVKRASDLTNQLLTFSKGGSPILKVASLENIIRENTSFVLSGSNVDYNIEIANNLWDVNIDTGQISQVVQNLIINSDQAMQEGGNIEIRLENTNGKDIPNIPGTEIPPGEYVQIEIKDTGKGIPKEIINKIFDPYFTTKQTGNGLGLATVYSIIDKHNGYIDLKSTENEGTVFTLYLPKAIIKNRGKKSTSQELVIETNSNFSKSKRILIMDDELLVQKVAEEIFKGLNFKVDLTKNGEEALEKFKESIINGKQYDIVLLDLTIPGGMGGEKTISKILELDPEVYAIATSGYSSDPVMANYKQYGF
ncbi:MAG: hypothetical protein DRP58_06940, partial [Spirochaetes bacterium]